MRLAFLLALPAAAALALLAIPMISTLFMHGAFSAHDVLMTRDALVAYSIGLVGLILVKILAPGFYARQDIRTPVRIALLTLAATQLMNLAFVWPLKHAGLALAISIGGCMNAALLFRGLRRAAIYRPEPGWGKFSAKLIVALACMSAVLWLCVGEAQWWFSSSTTYRVARLSGIVVLGAGVYFLALWLLGFRLANFTRRGAD
jgi:putative peptidoglycan lipid II flippase